jgi:uncharacterized protein (AIM24 family)
MSARASRVLPMICPQRGVCCGRRPPGRRLTSIPSGESMSEPLAVHADPVKAEFDGGQYAVEGTLVPQLVFHLSGSEAIFFEHHTLLWKDAATEISLKKLPGGLKRKVAGLDFFMTRAHGPGRIAFSHDSPGKVVTLAIQSGHELHVREHQFLAATDDLEYTFERVKGVRNMLWGGSGLFVDKFRSQGGEALVWLHGSGDLFEITLGTGEKLDVEAGAWLYKDSSVQMEAITMGLKAGIMGGGGKLTWNRFTGPGRLCLQTMFPSPIAAAENGGSNVAEGAELGAGLAVGAKIMGGLLKGGG